MCWLCDEITFLCELRVYLTNADKCATHNGLKIHLHSPMLTLLNWIDCIRRRLRVIFKLFRPCTLYRNPVNTNSSVRQIMCNGANILIGRLMVQHWQMSQWILPSIELSFTFHLGFCKEKYLFLCKLPKSLLIQAKYTKNKHRSWNAISFENYQ